MPKEILNLSGDTERPGPPEVYVTLRDLIALQFEARGFSFLPKYAVQSILSGRHRSKLRGRGLDFEEVRKYVKGDDIRNIDWKVTARVGTAHTKVFTEEKERPVLFIVDQSARMFYGSLKYMKSVIAAQLTAVGCWRVLEVGDRVGGFVFNDSRIEFITPKRNRHSVQRYLGLVANQNQELNQLGQGPKNLEHPLNEVLKQAAQIVKHDFLVVVVSDFKIADNQTMKSLIRMKKNNDVILTRITDPAEKKLPEAKITFTDGIYQTRLEGDRKIRKQFEEDHERIELKQSETFKKYGFPLLDFNTSETAAKQLRNLLSDQSKIRR